MESLIIRRSSPRPPPNHNRTSAGFMNHANVEYFPSDHWDRLIDQSLCHVAQCGCLGANASDALSRLPPVPVAHPPSTGYYQAGPAPYYYQPYDDYPPYDLATRPRAPPVEIMSVATMPTSFDGRHLAYDGHGVQNPYVGGLHTMPYIHDPQPQPSMPSPSNLHGPQRAAPMTAGPSHTWAPGNNFTPQPAQGAFLDSPAHFSSPHSSSGGYSYHEDDHTNFDTPQYPNSALQPPRGKYHYAVSPAGPPLIHTPQPMSPFARIEPGGAIISPAMDSTKMTGNYGPAAASAATEAAGNADGRVIYVGNLPAEASMDELLNLVRFGPIEDVHTLAKDGKICAFVSFLDGSTAAAFRSDAKVKKLALHGVGLRVDWGKPRHLSAKVLYAVRNEQATRNVYIGSLDENETETSLKDELSQFGPIDQVKIVRDKNIAFVHFMSIQTAMRVKEKLPKTAKWEGKRIGYGKDRCAYVPKAQLAQVQAAQKQAYDSMKSRLLRHQQQMLESGMLSPNAVYSPMTPGYQNMSPGFDFGPLMTPQGAFSPSFGAQGNCHIYIGNLTEETTEEDLCNHIRGGPISSVRVIKEKKCGFVTFVRPQDAWTFLQNAETYGVTINGRRVRVSSGTHVRPYDSLLEQQIDSGVSRNVYVGRITDFDVYTEAKLREDFAPYGTIEMINFLQAKGAAFINFTQIRFAQAAIEGIKSNPDYAEFRVSYGKDRCSSPFRLPSRRSSNGPRSQSPESNVADFAPSEVQVAPETQVPTEDDHQDASQQASAPVELQEVTNKQDDRKNVD